MHRSAVIPIAFGFIFAAQIAGADIKPHFVETPKSVDDIKRGVEDGLRCALGYFGPAKITDCSFAMARANAQDGSDTRNYNLGLTFETWRDLDVDWVADQKLVKSGQVTAAQLRDEEAAARAMYLLYRSARDATGISETHLLALMPKMTIPGKAATLERLQFWAKHAR